MVFVTFLTIILGPVISAVRALHVSGDKSDGDMHVNNQSNTDLTSGLVRRAPAAPSTETSVRDSIMLAKSPQGRAVSNITPATC